MTLKNWSWEKFDQLVADKYINVQRHPSTELFIANYAASCQYDRKWCEETEQSRGLIFDSNRTIVARPLRKFFNYSEVRPPNFVLTKTPVVTEKLDGSMGIYYRYQGTHGIATRGSFNSDQARWATNYWNNHHGHVTVPEGVSPIFEVIYKSNKIVVDYDYEGLVLLAVIDTASGSDIPLWETDWWDGPIVKQVHGLSNVEEAYSCATALDDGEGVVCAWFTPSEPSYRLKIKRPEYVRLHRIVTGVSNKTIWRHLKDGLPLTDILDNVPDEFYRWAKLTIESLQTGHDYLLQAIQDEFVELCKQVVSVVAKGSRNIPPDYTPDLNGWIDTCRINRADFASRAKKTKLSGCMFALLDNRMDRVEDYVWETIRPTYERPFTNVGDDI